MSGYSDNYIHRLLSSRTNPTNSSVRQVDVDQLRVSAHVVRSNFEDMNSWVDSDDMSQSALIIENSNTEGEKRVLKLLAMLHNYLSSLYSFNEQLVETVANYADIGSVKEDGIISLPDESTGYTRKLAFVRGLRHQIQHGDFRCLDVDTVDEVSEFSIKQIKFVEELFRQGCVDEPDKYLRTSSAEEREYPIPYIAEFHKKDFNQLASDCVEWLEKGTSKR